MMRILVHVAGMFVLGAAALVGAGILHSVRTNEPVAVVHPAERPHGTSGMLDEMARGPSASLLLHAGAGVSATLEAAASALESGRRTDGVIALDAAYRLTDVLQAADAHGPLAQLYPLAIAARTALQNGSPEHAASIARSAASAAEMAAARASAPPRPDDLAVFVGAVALSPTGRRIGDVVAATRNGLDISTGAFQNVLGFITFSSGTRLHVPAERIVFGQPRTVGMTTVIVDREPS